MSNQVTVRENVSAKELTTFAVGGKLSHLYQPHSLEALSELILKFNQEHIKYRILGAGSNVVIPDNGITFPVIRLPKEFSSFHYLSTSINQLDQILNLFNKKTIENLSNNDNSTTVFLFAFGAASLMSLSRKTAAFGLSGLEFAAGIPATIGGAVKMNAGAHGSSISDILTKAVILRSSGRIEVISKDNLNFNYRHSNIKNDEVILAAEFRLEMKSVEDVQKKRADCLQYRTDTQPLTMPSSGSVFRNPTVDVTGFGKISAAELLDNLGFKGKEKDGVAFSSMHANWLVRISEEAKASGVSSLIEDACHAVRQEYDVELKPEIELW